MACSIDDSLSTAGCSLKLPEPGYVLSPFVKVTFKRGGTTISVGNKSSPDNNDHAVIKDFEWGYSNGHECRLTILDEKGGSFVQFMTDMIKDFKKVTPDAYSMLVKFGWIKADCPSGVSLNQSDEYLFICDNIECNFTNGRFMFQITGTDIGPRIFEGRVEKVYGTDAQPMSLTAALRAMFTDDEFPPNVSTVDFRMKTSGGSPVPIEWLENGTEGLMGKWIPTGRDKLATAMAWVKDRLTKNNKAVIPVFSNEGEVKLTFWEDFRPKCGESKDYVSDCIGTYIVNGGKKSPVIEFNPRIRWNFNSIANMGGAMGNAAVSANEDGKVEGSPDCTTLKRKRLESAGATHVIVPSDQTANAYGGKEVLKIAENGEFEQLKAWKLFTEAIEADLVIVGDPQIARPIDAVMSKNVKIVFLNPRYIQDGCEWSESSCNEVMTNQAWIVKYVNHRISDGKYTTTIGCFLPVPGEDFDVGEPLGGEGSGGATIGGD